MPTSSVTSPSTNPQLSLGSLPHDCLCVVLEFLSVKHQLQWRGISTSFRDAIEENLCNFDGVLLQSTLNPAGMFDTWSAEQIAFLKQKLPKVFSPSAVVSKLPSLVPQDAPIINISILGDTSVGKRELLFPFFQAGPRVATSANPLPTQLPVPSGDNGPRVRDAEQSLFPFNTPIRLPFLTSTRGWIVFDVTVHTCKRELRADGDDEEPTMQDTGDVDGGDEAFLNPLADACFLVFSVRDRMSYKNIPSHFRNFYRVRDTTNMTLVATDIGAGDCCRVKARMVTFDRKKNINLAAVEPQVGCNAVQPFLHTARRHFNDPTLAFTDSLAILPTYFQQPPPPPAAQNVMHAGDSSTTATKRRERKGDPFNELADSSSTWLDHLEESLRPVIEEFDDEF